MLAIVKRVIDGDTFETAHGTLVRLSRFDAPELDEPGGEEVAAHLRQLITERKVRIKQVGTSYGRVVEEVWLDGESVNKAMGWFLAELDEQED